MKNGIKKLTALVLTAVFMIGLLPIGATASAADGELQTIRLVVDGDVYEVLAKLGTDGDWYVTQSILRQTLGIPSTDDQAYVSLHQAAKIANWSYEHDGVLNAAYIRTDRPYGAGSDYIAGMALPYVTARIASLDSGSTMNANDLRDLLTALVQDLAPEELEWFASKVNACDLELHRGEASVMAWYAAVAIGADDYNYHEFDNKLADGGDFWDMPLEYSTRMDALFPDWAKGPVQIEGEPDPWASEYVAAFLWNLWHKSPASGLQVIAYDYSAGSMRVHDPLTVADGICALARLYDSVVSGEIEQPYVSLTDPAAVTPNLTNALLEKAASTSITTIDDLPPLNGFVLNDGGSYEGREVVITTGDIEQVSNWGFSGSRIMLTYQTLFSDDGSQVNVEQMARLDALVAEAIRCDMHLNLLLFSLPGRWTNYNNETFQSTADLDLFVEGNTEDLEKAAAIWAVLAERYKDVPGAYLSFTPFWEAMNKNLSTGLSAPDYDEEDVLRVLRHLVDAIRAEDPDRFIIYEPTPNNATQTVLQESALAHQAMSQEYQNVRISYNFCEMPYVYAEMTATWGEHIDHNNHSMFKPDYPVTIYSLNGNVGPDDPLVLDGLLPAGTRIDVYITNAMDGVTMAVQADGTTLVSEALTESEYETGALLSGYYPYATSEKCISVTLEQDADEVAITSTGGWFGWCGIDVYLPEAYAQERWYFPSWYDAMQSGQEFNGPYLATTSRIMLTPNGYDCEVRRATIREDLTYTTALVNAESNAQTIALWCETIDAQSDRAVVRFENAYFSIGTTQKAAIAYYDDLLSGLAAVDFDWWSNDYRLILDGDFAGADPVAWKSYPRFNADLLRTFQKHQSGICDLVQPTLAVTNDAADGKIVLSWTPVPGAEQYEIWYAAEENGIFRKLDTVTETSAVHSDASAGTTYYYKVCSVTGESRSVFSEVIAGRVLELASPVLSVSNNATGKIILRWTAVPGAEKYEIWYAADEDGTFKKLGAVTGTSVTHSSAEAGTTYYYKIRSAAGENYSVFSDVVSGKVLTLAQPTLTAGNKASTGKITLSWTAVPGAEKYEIWYASSKNGTYKKLGAVAGTSTTHSSAVAGSTYYYKVRAVAGELTGAFSAAVGKTCDLAQPTLTVSNKASSGKIVLSWKAIPGASKYTIYVASSKNGTYKVLGTVTGTSVTHSSAEAGKTYYYRVKAIHASVSGANSAAGAAVGKTCDLARPTLRVTLNSNGKPVLSWSAISGAAKYEIWAAAGENGAYTKIGTITGTKVTHSSATSGVTYFYKIRAISAVSSSANSAYSPIQSITVE